MLYPSQAMLVHPDKNEGNENVEEAFKRLQNAYEVFLNLTCICFFQILVVRWITYSLLICGSNQHSNVLNFECVSFYLMRSRGSAMMMNYGGKRLL